MRRERILPLPGLANKLKKSLIPSPFGLKTLGIKISSPASRTRRLKIASTGHPLVSIAMSRMVVVRAGKAKGEGQEGQERILVGLHSNMLTEPVGFIVRLAVSPAVMDGGPNISMSSGSISSPVKVKVSLWHPRASVRRKVFVPDSAEMAAGRSSMLRVSPVS